MSKVYYMPGVETPEQKREALVEALAELYADQCDRQAAELHAGAMKDVLYDHTDPVNGHDVWENSSENEDGPYEWSSDSIIKSVMLKARDVLKLRHKKGK